MGQERDNYVLVCIQIKGADPHFLMRLFSDTLNFLLMENFPSIFS